MKFRIIHLITSSPHHLITCHLITMPLLLLIDGHSQAYRAFFGMKTPLTTRDGEPTAAVYGFARKLLSVLSEYQPDYVAVAFDTGDTWRHAEFADYKATRDACPTTCAPRWPASKRFCARSTFPSSPIRISRPTMSWARWRRPPQPRAPMC